MAVVRANSAKAAGMDGSWLYNDVGTCASRVSVRNADLDSRRDPRKREKEREKATLLKEKSFSQ